mmetsp:Transcript_33690/g.103373  ORF Transcript_33690/g.103373 Transcript_33690/m.103373 type:complete len:206 (-) Transcript_33690:248-865(-)
MDLVRRRAQGLGRDDAVQAHHDSLYRPRLRGRGAAPAAAVAGARDETRRREARRVPQARRQARAAPRGGPRRRRPVDVGRGPPPRARARLRRRRLVRDGRAGDLGVAPRLPLGGGAAPGRGLLRVERRRDSRHDPRARPGVGAAAARVRRTARNRANETWTRLRPRALLHAAVTRRRAGRRRSRPRPPNRTRASFTRPSGRALEN